MRLQVYFFILLYTSISSVVEGASFIVPFQMVDNRIFAEVFINEHGPFNFIFDTGSTNVMSPLVAQKLKLITKADVDGTGAGKKKFRVETTYVDQLRVGSIELRNQKFSVIDLSDIQKAFLLKSLDGMFGYEVLQKYLTKIDYVRNTLTFFSDPKGFSSANFERISFEMIAQKPVIDATISGLPAKILIDTGDRSALTLFKNFTINPSIGKIFTGKSEQITGYGGGGPIPARLGHVNSMKFGSVLMKNIIARAPTTKNGFNALKNMNASMGNEILKQFDVAFDYMGNRIYIKKNKNFGILTKFTSVPNPKLN